MSDPARPTEPDPGNDGAPPPSRTPTPPVEPGPPLGLDRAWAELTSGGRLLVVIVAAALTVAAAVGIGLAASGGGDDDGTVVLAETAGGAVTLEVPADPTTVTDVLPETVTDVLPETVTDVLPETVTAPPSTVTDIVPEPTETNAGGAPSQVFSSGETDDIGAVTVDEPSTLVWTSGGGQFVLQDLLSGATLVDSSESGGEVDLEAGEFDMLLSADSEWTVEIRPR